MNTDWHLLLHLLPPRPQANSKPMQQIIARLTAGGEFEVFFFGDQVCWPGLGSVVSCVCAVQDADCSSSGCVWLGAQHDRLHALTRRHAPSPRHPQVILEAPVEAWPLVDVLLSWHSEGFPLHKAQAYVELRRPFLVNDGGCDGRE
jgi:hypothetical protein